MNGEYKKGRWIDGGELEPGRDEDVVIFCEGEVMEVMYPWRLNKRNKPDPESWEWVQEMAGIYRVRNYLGCPWRPLNVWGAEVDSNCTVHKIHSNGFVLMNGIVHDVTDGSELVLVVKGDVLHVHINGEEAGTVKWSGGNRYLNVHHLATARQTIERLKAEGVPEEKNSTGMGTKENKKPVGTWKTWEKVPVCMAGEASGAKRILCQLRNLDTGEFADDMYLKTYGNQNRDSWNWVNRNAANRPRGEKYKVWDFKGCEWRPISEKPEESAYKIPERKQAIPSGVGVMDKLMVGGIPEGASRVISEAVITESPSEVKDQPVSEEIEWGLLDEIQSAKNKYWMETRVAQGTHLIVDRITYSKLVKIYKECKRWFTEKTPGRIKDVLGLKLVVNMLTTDKEILVVGVAEDPHAQKKCGHGGVPGFISGGPAKDDNRTMEFCTFPEAAYGKGTVEVTGEVEKKAINRDLV